MLNQLPTLLGFVAPSGTGKTTLITAIIPLLKQYGLNIALIKHSHHDFDIDYPGKDSYRFRKAGASSVMVVSSYRRALITEFDDKKEPTLAEQLTFFTQKDIDLILVEGFKNEKIPKIQLYRSDLLSACVVMNDPELLAIAADIPLDLLTSPVKLDINKPQQIAEFIVSWLHTVNINKLSTFSDKADAF